MKPLKGECWPQGIVWVGSRSWIAGSQSVWAQSIIIILVRVHCTLCNNYTYLSQGIVWVESRSWIAGSQSVWAQSIHVSYLLVRVHCTLCNNYTYLYMYMCMYSYEYMYILQCMYVRR